MKRKRCDKGINCKGTCIARGEVCQGKLTYEAQQALSKAKEKVKDNNVDIQVGVIGIAASVVGNSIGGPLGGIAAELAASLATRKANHDVEAVQRAYSKVKRQERYKKARKIEKARLVLAEAATQVRESGKAREIKLDLIEESVGFTIGNIGARILPTSLPLKGAALSLALTPSMMKRIEPRVK